MINNDLISVIIPVYNVEKYIRKCIDSVIGQDYKNIEIILVDDGSPDNCPSICDEYHKKDNRIVVLHKNNGGVSAARNEGLKKAKGKYIIFIDADDWIDPNFVSYFYKLIKLDKSQMVFSSECKKYKTDKSIKSIVEQKIDRIQGVNLLLSLNIEVGCWNKMYEREFLLKNNLFFDESLYFGEGLQFITAVALKSESISYTTAKLYNYRQNNLSSATTAFGIDKYINGEKALMLIHDIIKNNKENLCAYNTHLCFYYMNAVTLICVNEKKNEYNEVYKKWRKQFKMLAPKVLLHGKLKMSQKKDLLFSWFFFRLRILRIKHNKFKYINKSIE